MTAQPDSEGPRDYSDPRIKGLIHRLAEAEIALTEALGDSVDAVVDPIGAVPIMLRQAQEALSIAEGRYSRLLARLPAIIFELLPDGTTIYVNPSLVDVTGYWPDELIGANWWDRLVPDDERGHADALRERLRHGDVAAAPLRITARDGTTCTLELDSANEYDADGVVQRILCIAVDITEKERTERHLRESREMLNTIYRESPSILVVSTLDEGRYLMVNQAFERLTGYSADEAVGRTSRELGIFADYADRARMLERLARDGIVRNMEVHYRTRRGDSIIGLTSVTKINTGGQDCMMAQVNDITDLKQTEEALRESEERFRLLAENADDVIYLYRLLPEPRFEYVNPAVTRIVGYSAEEFRADAGMAAALLLPEDRPGWEQRMYAHALNREPLVIRWLHKNGAIIWMEQRDAPLYDDDGRVRALIGIARDITPRKRAEEDRDLYLHTISHDLRLPLTVIRGHGQMLRDLLEERQAAPEELASVDAMLNAVSRMNVLIQDMVDVARLEGQHLVLNLRPVALDAFLNALLAHARAILEVSRLTVEIPPQFPPVLADPDRLERIIVNLVSNALKYSSPDSPVTLRVTREGDHACLAIIDTGRGIARDELPYLFKRFYRTRSAASTEGVGLGLYITKMLVEAHGGTIGVHSIPGEGSTFWLTLPLAPRDA